MNKSPIVRVPFHFYGTIVLAGGVATLQVRPDLFGSGLLSISDAYQNFRVPRLAFRIFANAAPAAAGVVTGDPNTAPNSLASIMELMDAVVHQSTLETVWSRWVRVDKKVLAGPFPWYHTRAGTFDPTESIPALMCFAGTGTDNIQLEVIGLMEFKDICATADTPAAVELRRRARELVTQAGREKDRAQLIHVLSASGADPSPRFITVPSQPAGIPPRQ